MIKDKIENAKDYYKLSEKIEKAFVWLKQENLNNIEDGKYELEGSDIYVNVQTYTTKDAALFEAHRNYIDIQYMIQGIENIGVTNYNNCNSEIEYNVQKDIEFLNCKDKYINETLKEGEFLILYPQDAHKPSIKYESNQVVKKAVAKIKI